MRGSVWAVTWCVCVLTMGGWRTLQEPHDGRLGARCVRPGRLHREQQAGLGRHREPRGPSAERSAAHKPGSGLTDATWVSLEKWGVFLLPWKHGDAGRILRGLGHGGHSLGLWLFESLRMRGRLWGEAGVP